jgi:hypothetical protein
LACNPAKPSNPMAVTTKAIKTSISPTPACRCLIFKIFTDVD